MTSYEKLDELKDNNRRQQSSQFEREADPHSQDGSYTELRRNQSVDDTRESNQYHDTDDYDTRDSTNSPRIIDYRDMNRDTRSRNNNSQYGGGTQPTNISRSDRGQNNCPSSSTNQFYDDPRENEGYSRVLDNSNQYQDDRDFNSDNGNNRYTNDSNVGQQQNRASNSSTSRQDQSGYEPRSRQNVAPVASNRDRKSVV